MKPPSSRRNADSSYLGGYLGWERGPELYRGLAEDCGLEPAVHGPPILRRERYWRQGDCWRQKQKQLPLPSSYNILSLRCVSSGCYHHLCSTQSFFSIMVSNFRLLRAISTLIIIETNNTLTLTNGSNLQLIALWSFVKLAGANWSKVAKNRK